MKEVLFLNTNHAWGGGEKWHFEMAKALSKSGFKTHVICSPNGQLESKCAQENIPTSQLKTTNLSFLNPFKLVQLFSEIKKTKAKIVFLNLPIDAKMASLLKSLLKLEKLIYRRGMPHPIKNTYINRFVFNRVDLVIANSKEIKASISKNLKELDHKTTIVYNGVTPLNTSPRDLKTEKIRLGNLGRLVEQKGQEHLIKVAKYLKEKNFNFSLVIAGTGPLESKLKELIEKNSLHNEISLAGHVNPSDFFANIDIFLFPSHFEGSANALIEAQQYGIPSIAFNISSMPEVLKTEHQGYLIEPYDEKAFAKRIIELASNKETYNQYSQNCLNNIIQHFDYGQKVKQVENIINE